MNSIKVRCPAKINLFLNIIGKDKNYHKMHMINQAISLYDYLTIKKIDKGIILKSDNDLIPLDDKNSVYKAIELFLDYTKLDVGVEVVIDKNIPMEAGLGGESADAAGVLIGLNKLFNTNLDLDILLNLGFKVGCDVPFCIKSGTKEVLGYGEILRDYEVDYSNFLVVKPPVRLSTKEMFIKYDSINKYEDIPISIGHNDFEKVIDNDLVNLIDLVKNTGAVYSFLSGSGSSIIGIYNSYEDLKIAYNKLLNILDDNYQLFVTSSVFKIGIE